MTHRSKQASHPAESRSGKQGSIHDHGPEVQTRIGQATNARALHCTKLNGAPNSYLKAENVKVLVALALVRAHPEKQNETRCARGQSEADLAVRRDSKGSAGLTSATTRSVKHGRWVNRRRTTHWQMSWLTILPPKVVSSSFSCATQRKYSHTCLISRTHKTELHHTLHPNTQLPSARNDRSNRART
jgi:hypothetical protein